MKKKLVYLKVSPDDYGILTNIMTSAFNEDTSMHTGLKEGGPKGYNDGSLIKRLNEHENFESCKIIYENDIAGAYTVAIGPDNEYVLEMLFIDPKYRRDHLGSIVWKDIEQKYADAKKWIVETPEYSKRNYYFYTEKCGFVFKTVNIYDDGAKSFIFEKGKRIVPTLDEARSLLRDGQRLSPGPWVDHSINVGKAARLIAEKCKDIDPDTALVLGMLHDIGYSYGHTDIKHILYGYNFAMEKGYSRLARICLTHSFNCHDIRVSLGRLDCFSQEEYDFIKNYIENVEYDDYDRLIQLCDALALPGGFCLMEKRMVDVVLRHGINDRIIDKWKATFETKKHFEEKIGASIYSVLPGVIENTFEI